MNRRDFSKRVVAAAVAPATAADLLAGQEPKPASQGHDDGMMKLVQALSVEGSTPDAIHPKTPRTVAMLVYPGMFALDMVGPHSVLSGMMNTKVHLVWKDLSPVNAGGISVVPTMTLDRCPDNLDVLFVPGGGLGTVAMMSDAAVQAFLKARGKTAKYVTSVCTGSLVLGAAGLLKGYRATTHWVTHQVLSTLGATPVNERVVVDRNRVTAAGVSAGIDFALVLAERMTGTGYAKGLQLNIEYDPDPPFKAGSPAGAGPRIATAMREMYQPIVDAAEKAARAARAG